MRKKIEKSIVNTVRFLKESQGSDGLWKDYQLITGESTSWVTSYTGCALLQLQTDGVINNIVQERQISSMIDRAKEGLLADKTLVAGGWGYNPQLYPDADSTAIALRFLLGSKMSFEHPSLQRGLQIIKQSQQKDGGCSTYLKKDLRGEQFIGWTQSHLSVTMACIIAWDEAKKYSVIESERVQFDTQMNEAISYLEKHPKNIHSLWEDYWWVGPYYPTYLVISVLKRFHLIDNHTIDKLIAGILDYQNDDGGFGDMQEQSDGFATALTLTTLITLYPNILNESRQAIIALEWLLKQERNGMFPPGAYLRMPTPTFRQRESEVNQRVSGETNGIFTAATVLVLLSQILVVHEEWSESFVSHN